MEEPKGHHHRKHKGRNDLIGEHRWGDLLQLVLLFLFLTIWIADSFFLHWTTQLAEWIPEWIRLTLAGLLLIVAGYLSFKGLRIVFGEVREKPEVITKSVFSVVRHPIYLGSVLVYLGWTLITGSLASLGLWVIILLFYYFISQYEERLLIRHFGDAYREYQKRVPMLIPFRF